MNLANNFKYIAFISLLTLISSTALAKDQMCKRYDKESHEYQDIIKNTKKYTFYDGVNCEILDNFLDKLEKAIKNDDFDEISDLMSYPFNWNHDKKTTLIKNKAQFKKFYKEIFTDKVKKIAIESEVAEVGYRGFMIGRHGVIWFKPNLGIIAINQPD